MFWDFQNEVILGHTVGFHLDLWRLQLIEGSLWEPVTTLSGTQATWGDHVWLLQVTAQVSSQLTNLTIASHPSGPLRHQA